MLTMLVKTTEGYRDGGNARDTLFSMNAKDVVAHFKGNCLTGGFSVQYAGNPETGEVVELFRKGRICQRDVKGLIADGFKVWTYSWCWAPDTFEWADGRRVTVERKIDCSPKDTTRTAMAYGRALGVF